MSLLDYSDMLEALSSDGQRDDPDDDVITRLRQDDALEIPIQLTDLEVWGNFMSNDLYEMDKKVREFLGKTRYQRAKKGKWRTTVPMVFAWIYGRQPGPSDGSACRLLHKLLRHYCTNWTGQTTFMGKPVSRVYYFSRYKTNSMRPYSIRLRMEEAAKHGKDVSLRQSPGFDKDKRTYGRRANRPDGEREA